MPKLQRLASGKIIKRGGKLMRMNEDDSDCCCPATYEFCTNCPPQGLLAQYSNNSTAHANDGGILIATGPFVVERTGESPIDFSFPTDRPGGVNAAFQVQWSGRIYAPVTGNYTFHTTVTNGAVGVSVNGSAVINQWTTPTSGSFSSSTVALTAGNYYHFVAVYRNQSGAAGSVKVEWSHPSQTRQTIPASMLVDNKYLFPGPTVSNGIPASYYNTTDLTGSVALSQVDGNINFTWAGSPGSGVNADNFSVRWEGILWVSTAGKPSIVFSTDTKDGIRLWVNNQQIINDWNDHGGSTTTNTATAIELRQGFYPIKMEVYSKTGTGLAQLYWAINGAARAIVTNTNFFASGTAEDRPDRITLTFADVEMAPAGSCGGSAPSIFKYVSGGLDGVTLCLRQVSACRYEFNSKYDGDSPIVIHSSATNCASTTANPNIRFIATVIYGGSGVPTGYVEIEAGYATGDGGTPNQFFARQASYVRPTGLCSGSVTQTSSSVSFVFPTQFGKNGTATVTDGCDE